MGSGNGLCVQQLCIKYESHIPSFCTHVYTYTHTSLIHWSSKKKIREEGLISTVRTSEAPQVIWGTWKLLVRVA